MVSAGQEEDRTICGACRCLQLEVLSSWLPSKASSLAAGRGQLCLRIAVPHKISETAISPSAANPRRDAPDDKSEVPVLAGAGHQAEEDSVSSSSDVSMNI